MEFPDGLEKIGLKAFMGSGIEHAELPASINTIAQGAFAKCESLKTVKFGEGLEVLGTDEYFLKEDTPESYWGVFERSAVECVELPTTLKRMEYSVFENCKNLKSINLPTSLKYIGARCF